MGNKVSGVLSPEDLHAKLPVLSVDDIRYIFSEYARISSLDKPLSLKKFLMLMSALNSPTSPVANRTFRCPELQRMFFFYSDTSHDDRVDVVELIRIIGVFHSDDPAERAKIVFQSLDIDNDGLVSKSDLLRGLIRIFDFVRVRAHSTSKLLNRHGLQLSES